MATNIKERTLPQLEDFLLSIGEKRFRARQIFKWAYQKRLAGFDEMNNMPKTLRARLGETATLAKLPVRAALESKRGDAVKFGFVVDGDIGTNISTNKKRHYIIESVLLIDGDRRTLCVSSQIGCGLGCTFCETGRMGFVRNLTQGEIVGQLVGANDYLAGKGDKVVTNVVFMGMGEALSNFENFIAALGVIMHEDAFNIGARRITVSTAGVVPSIERLMREELTIGLAISLNAWNDTMRSEMMPINKVYPIERLISVGKKYYAKTGRRVTFEYVLIEGVTDTAEAVEALGGMLGGWPCKVNLIPVNPIVGGVEILKSKSKSNSYYGGRASPAMRGEPPRNAPRAKSKSTSAPNDAAVERFANELHRRGLAVTVRKSRGQDIMGACGQLAAWLLDNDID